MKKQFEFNPPEQAGLRDWAFKPRRLSAKRNCICHGTELQQLAGCKTFLVTHTAVGKK